MTEPVLTAWRKHAGCAALFTILVCGLPPTVRSQDNSTAIVGARHDLPAQGSSQGPLNLPAYIEELDRWASAVESLKTDARQAAELRQKLPQRWPVAVGPHPVEVSTSWLRAGLNDIAKDPKSSAAGPLLEHVRAMRREAQDLAGGRQYPDASASGKLDQILARPEFGGVHGPTWLDRMIDRAGRWLARQMDRFGTRLSGHPRIVRWMFWVFLIGAAGVLLVWMTRRLLQGTGTERLVLPWPESDAARSLRDLARQAREAAARGDFREATRFAYWMGIHRLEELGLWTADPTRTHREYLRLVGSDKPQRQPLEALTRQFEHVWYALQPASEGDFQFTVEQLEKLGCAMPWGQTTNRS